MGLAIFVIILYALVAVGTWKLLGWDARRRTQRLEATKAALAKWEQDDEECQRKTVAAMEAYDIAPTFENHVAVLTAVTEWMNHVESIEDLV